LILEERQMSDGTARHSRAWIAVLAIIAVVAIAAAAVSGSFARRFYLERARLQLNPEFQTRFREENARLGPAAKPRIVMFGDSRIALWQPRPMLPEAEIIWRGIGGETTAQMVHRLPNDTHSIGASVVVLQGGINDLTAAVALGTGPAAVEKTFQNLRGMAERSVAAGSHVLLFTVVPPASPSLLRRFVWSDVIYDLTAQLNTRLRALAGANLTVVDAAQVLCGTSERLPSDLASGTVHFQPAAYTRLNAELIRELKVAHALQQ
jgi:lysophospholipase L1-like esterase